MAKTGAELSAAFRTRHPDRVRISRREYIDHGGREVAKAYRERNKDKIAANRAAYRAANKDKLAVYNKAYRQRTSFKEDSRIGYIHRQYGLTVDEYYAILAAQGERCAICLVDISKPRAAHVDHNHACCAGTRSCGHCVRGFLCYKCNVGLGNFGDDPFRLTSAIRYIETPR